MHRTAEIFVLGNVQAVGYRLFTKRYADHFHITGFVQNQTDGSVKVVATGDEANLASFIEKLREGPRMAMVQELKVTWLDWGNTHTEFVIV
ncbi:MAG: acylphosphatase [Halobacteriota archaeon]